MTNADNNSISNNVTNDNDNNSKDNNNDNNKKNDISNDDNKSNGNSNNNDSSNKTNNSLETRIHDDDDDDDEDENLDNDPQFKRIIQIVNDPWTLYSSKQIKIIFSKIISFIRSPFSSSSSSTNKNKDDLDSIFAPTSQINKLLADWLYLNQSMFVIISMVCSLATIPVPNQNHHLWGSELTIVNEMKALKNTFLQLQNKTKPPSSTSSSSSSSFINIYKDVMLLKLKVLLTWKLPKSLIKNQKLLQDYLNCSSVFENLLWGKNIRCINFNNIHFSNNFDNNKNNDNSKNKNRENKNQFQNYNKNNNKNNKVTKNNIPNNKSNINHKNKKDEKRNNVIDYYNYHIYTRDNNSGNNNTNNNNTSPFHKPPFDNLFQWMDQYDYTPPSSPSHDQIRNALHLVFSCLNSQQHTKANAELLSLNLSLQELQYLAVRCHNRVDTNNNNDDNKNKNGVTNDTIGDGNNDIQQSNTYNGVSNGQSTLRDNIDKTSGKNKSDKTRNTFNGGECSTLIGYRYIALYLSTFDQLEHWKLLWVKNRTNVIKSKNLIGMMKTLRKTYKQDILIQLSLQLISDLSLTHFYGGTYKKNNDKNEEDDDKIIGDDDDDQYWMNSIFRNKIGIIDFKEKQISFLHEILQHSLMKESLWQIQQHKNLLLRHYHYNNGIKNNKDIPNGCSSIDYDNGTKDVDPGDDSDDSYDIDNGDGINGDSDVGDGKNRVLEIWKKQARIYKLRLDKSKLKLANKNREMDVRMNLLLADRFGDLILETSKLQSKVAQLEKLLKTTEERSRAEIKAEMIGNLKKLFVSLAQSKIKEDQFRCNYINDLQERFANCCTKTYQQLQSTIVNNNNKHQHHLQRHLNVLERLAESEKEGEILKSQLMLMKGVVGWRKWCDQMTYNKQLKEVRDSEIKWRELKQQAESSAKNASVVREVQLKAAKKALISSVQCNKELKTALECESKNASTKAMSITEELKNEREEKEDKIRKIKFLKELLEEKEKVEVDLRHKLNSFENKHHVMQQKWANEVKEIKRKLKMEKKSQALNAAFQSKEMADDTENYGTNSRQLERPLTCRVKSSPVKKTGAYQRHTPLRSRCKSAHVRFEGMEKEKNGDKDENIEKLKSYNGNKQRIESARKKDRTNNHKKQNTANTTTNLTITTLIAEQLIKHSPPPDHAFFHRTVKSASNARPAKKTLFANQKSAVFSSRSVDGGSNYF